MASDPHGPLLQVSGLAAAYGRVRALEEVSLEVAQGALVALIGANGAGKTTLLRTLSGVQPAAAGAIRLDGADITRARPRERVRAGLAQVPEGRQVFGPLSVEDNLRLGGILRDAASSERILERVWALFPVLREKRRLTAGMLSGGQQQMVAIGRALMTQPRLLLLDEPSMGLAPKLVAEVFATIRRLREEGTSVLLVEQNAHAALSIADHAYVLETGRIVMQGPGRELAGNAQVREAYLGM
ncbi:MAG: ABC transporter ATP-binding protein [Betaproteobacteria bacterium]|jgi:branched-chain amino acid transport system ATP-binding protein|nr:ABC transporter ATP-binding protein [Rhodocyclaceae bacterium]MCA3135942.1 ABC transporter ATP-binding protein [Rhodocyclaceae bacterium]MCA3143476.1 ABC transporter ATP-binding protein [Rhodocyclaceae bacterium]MCA3146739.1 ABC transporter ATP-binding protein [Rhodocyclaceae bacterium]MCE2899188.1 ABC transporter ATP-binding protein [Betaproteobacteria bacterium]